MKDDIERLNKLAEEGDVGALSRLHKLASRRNLPIFEGPFIQHMQRYIQARAEIYIRRSLLGLSKSEVPRQMSSFWGDLSNDFHREVDRLVHHKDWKETKYYRTEDRDVSRSRTQLSAPGFGRPSVADALYGEQQIRLSHNFIVWLGPKQYIMTLNLDF